MNEDFMKLIELEYQEFKLSLEKTSVEGKGTPQEIADRRELLFHNLLAKYFPFPFRITKGNVIDSYNNRSCSIDCIVLDPSHPFTVDAKNNRASIIMADGVDFAIELKGTLNDDVEIERLIKQTLNIKKLTRVKTGILYTKEKNPLWFKIPVIIYIQKTYANPTKLIDKILNYYLQNNIKRINQFDVLIAGDYVFVNAVKGTISFNGGSNKIYYKNAGNQCFAILLFLMANIPLVQPLMSENIYNIYFKNIFKDVYENEEWNNILTNIEKK